MVDRPRVFAAACFEVRAASLNPELAIRPSPAQRLPPPVLLMIFISDPYTPTGNGFVCGSPRLVRRSKRPCSNDIRAVYQYPITKMIRNGTVM